MTDQPKPHDEDAEVERRIREAGERALEEAAARRKAAKQAKPGPRELGGRDGPEPVRYGDWEVNGIATDF